MSRRNSKKLVSLIVAVISLVAYIGQENGWWAKAQEAAIENQPGQYSVTRFSDGDTITIDMNGKEETIRFIGADTPETHDPRKAVQCYGPAASAYTKNIITAQGKKVRLAGDAKSSNRDRYDRLLRYVYLPDGTLLNQKLIAEGYAFYYPYFPFTKSDDFAAAQQAARSANKGVWGSCSPKPTDGGGYISNDQ